MANQSQGREMLKVTNVNASIKKRLKLIAKYEGITVSQLLRPKFREVCEGYPDNETLEKLTKPD